MHTVTTDKEITVLHIFQPRAINCNIYTPVDHVNAIATFYLTMFVLTAKHVTTQNNTQSIVGKQQISGKYMVFRQSNHSTEYTTYVCNTFLQKVI